MEQHSNTLREFSKLLKSKRQARSTLHNTMENALKQLANRHTNFILYTLYTQVYRKYSQIVKVHEFTPNDQRIGVILKLQTYYS